MVNNCPSDLFDLQLSILDVESFGRRGRRHRILDVPSTCLNSMSLDEAPTEGTVPTNLH